MQCRDAFVSEGGQRLGVISCLNDDAHWAQGFAAIIERHLQGWRQEEP